MESFCNCFQIVIHFCLLSFIIIFIGIELGISSVNKIINPTVINFNNGLSIVQILSLIISVICFITTLIISIIVWNGQIGYME